MRDHEKLIAVGRISGTHGIKGHLRLHSYSGNIETFSAADRIILKKHVTDNGFREMEITDLRQHGSGFIIKLNGFDDINMVEPFLGYDVYLRREQFPEPDDDEYYWCDLIGLNVVTREGVRLGIIDHIFETGSSDIYVVRDGEREYLIPAIADIIADVDIAGGVMTITPQDGLLDL